MPPRNPFMRLVCARCEMRFDVSGDPDACDQGRYMDNGAAYCDDCDDVHQTGNMKCATCRSKIPYDDIFWGNAGQGRHQSAFRCQPCWHEVEGSSSEDEEDEPPARPALLGPGATFRDFHRDQEDAAARNQRDLGRLRAAFPGHCCHNLLYSYVLRRGKGCTAQQQQNEENEVGYYSGGRFRDHDIPDDIDDMELESWP